MMRPPQTLRRKRGPQVGGATSDSKTFGPYLDDTIASFLKKVTKQGMTVTGGDPLWHIDANQHGVKVDAVKNADSTVTLSIAGKNFYVSAGQVWDKLSPAMPKADVLPKKNGTTAPAAPIPDVHTDVHADAAPPPSPQAQTTTEKAADAVEQKASALPWIVVGALVVWGLSSSRY